MRTLLVSLIFFSQFSFGSVSLWEKKDWKLLSGGFVQLDYLYDTHGGFLETAGNAAIDGPDEAAGVGPREQVSFRNSRAGFTLLPPGQDTWKPKAYIEFDLLGNHSYRPFFGSSDISYTDPSLRIRHLYVSAEWEGWSFLSGQTWNFFGWGPSYFLTTVSVPPGPGSLYQRAQQFTVTKTLDAKDFQSWKFGLSFGHATQKAGGVPNVDMGVKYSHAGIRSGFSTPSGETGLEPFSLALSGTMRKFGIGAIDSTSPNLHKHKAFAASLATLIPIVPGEYNEASNTLTLTAEYAAGTGIGDLYPGWSANISELPTAGGTDMQGTYLRRGIGGFDAAGKFHLIQLHSWNMQLQYHLPSKLRGFATAGHSELKASNVAGLGPVLPGFTSYDRASMDFVNLFHDFSGSLRGAIEYAHFSTHYTSGREEVDDRYQATVFYRY